ncbi:MAG: alpha/beta hydrolase [Gammaproteobacteria bacterium]|nr:alpha/beta hydrolase [Gammaproteobacteria bacterium]
MFDRCKEGLSSFPVTIPGPSGTLEGIVDCAAGSPLGGAVICHPHPLYGGTMQNKVVHTLAKSLTASNRTAVRFNFRGVGVSTGVYDEGAGETDDALAVLDWLASSQPGLPMILAGFSFGSYIALQVAAEADSAALITVAPPVGMFDFENLSSIICPWLLIQGDEDEVVDSNSVINWVHSLENPPQLEIVRGASHFFHGKLLDLRSVCGNFLQNL